VLYKRAHKRDLEPLSRLILTNRVTCPTAGYRLMYKILRRQGAECTRSEVREVYVRLNLMGKRAPPRMRTTNSRHAFQRYPNLVKDLKIERPDQVWVADTMEFRIGGKRTFLALVEDIFTRRALGFALSFVNDSLLTLEALEMALRFGTPEIHHSDQGGTYASGRFTRKLLNLNVVISMAAAGKAWENGYAERLNKTFRYEEIVRSDYLTIQEARNQIAAYVKLYNNQRIHMSLGYRTPNEVNEAQAKDKENRE